MNIGSWVQIGHPANAEILAGCGFDFMVLDCEHGEADESAVGNFCRAVHRFQCRALVRVRANDTLAIRRALDLGADGVIVPLVNSGAEAARAVAAAYYPPEGIRGFAWQRGNRWGAEFDAYAQNFRPFVMVMVESKEAVEAIEEILVVPRLDGVLIGPYDLSGSYGIAGQTGHPLIAGACARVGEACRRHGKIAGQHIVTPTPENIAGAQEQGYSFLALGMDSYFLNRGAMEVIGLCKRS